MRGNKKNNLKRSFSGLETCFHSLWHHRPKLLLIAMSRTGNRKVRRPICVSVESSCSTCSTNIDKMTQPSALLYLLAIRSEDWSSNRPRSLPIMAMNSLKYASLLRVQCSWARHFRAAMLPGLQHGSSEPRGMISQYCGLEAGSPDLLALTRDFWSGYGNLPIICFFEKSDSQYGPIQVRTVNSQSATLLGKRRIHLDADHSKLKKFRSADDENFQLFLPEFKKMVSHAIDDHSPCKY